MRLKFVLKGGPGSGNFDHAGRPGKVGGSTSGNGSVLLQEADELWFEYANAQVMKAHSRGENVSGMGEQGEQFSDKELARLMAASDVMQKAANTHHTTHKRVWRGQALESVSELKRMYPVNKKVTIDSLSATSPDRKLASVYSDTQFIGGDGISVLLHIENPRGVIGYQRQDGGEVVLPAGANYKVTRMWQEDGVYNVTLWSTDKR